MFKDLTERFQAKMDALYAIGSTRDRVWKGEVLNDEPYRETKPNNPNLPNFGESRTTPLHSIAADFTRLSRWSTHHKGVMWLLNQQVLQAGNTFSETRIINPLFVVGNTQPFLHLKRSLATAVGDDLGGGTQPTKSPASDGKIGGAGRLQKATSKHINTLISTGNTSLASRILSIMPPNPIANLVSTVVNVLDNGIEGIDERPEFNMIIPTKSPIYSIAYWEGFRKAEGEVGILDRVASSLRSGNIGAAGRLLGIGGGDRVATDNASAPPTSVRTSHRYFMNPGSGATVGTDDQLGRTNRYIPDSVTFSPVGDTGTYSPYVTITKSPAENFSSYVTMTNYSSGLYSLPPQDIVATINTATQGFLAADATRTADAARVATWNAAETQNAIDFVAQQNLIQQQRVNDAIAAEFPPASSRVDEIEAMMSGNPLPSTRTVQQVTLDTIASNPVSRYRTRPYPMVGEEVEIENTPPPAPQPENPSEDSMLFPETSLRRKLVDGDSNHPYVDIQKMYLEDQITKWTDTIKSLTGIGAGFKGGVRVTGNPTELIAGSRFALPITERDDWRKRRYFHDPMNDGLGPTFFQDTSGKVTRNTRTAISDAGEQIADLIFYDYINKFAIPFRAFIQGLTEAVSPEYQDTFFIGRPERNIVYIGVKRDVSFTLFIQAFADLELETIWRKINYLSSLCFPGNYNNGFMIPPFIKFTLGDMYSNQPAYIKSLTFTVDENTPWEITRDMQVPHGVTANISMALIEKRQHSSADYHGPYLPDMPLYGKPDIEPPLPPAPIIPPFSMPPTVEAPVARRSPEPGTRPPQPRRPAVQIRQLSGNPPPGNVIRARVAPLRATTAGALAEHSVGSQSTQ